MPNEVALKRNATIRPHRKALMCFCALLSWCWLVGMSHCEPAWQRSLRIKPPKGSKQKQIQWFRKAFYQLTLEEKRRKDGGDRTRRLLRKWPALAQSTYMANQRRLRARHREGLSLDRLDRFNLIMNAFIRQTLPKLSLPPLNLNRRKRPTKRKDDTAGQ